MMNRPEKLELDSLLLSIALIISSCEEQIHEEILKYRLKNLKTNSEPLGNTNPTLSCAKSIDKVM